jgi:hypothetical protein
MLSKKKRGNLCKIKPLIFWSFRAFKAKVLGSSPSRLTTSFNIFCVSFLCSRGLFFLR